MTARRDYRAVPRNSDRTLKDSDTTQASTLDDALDSGVGDAQVIPLPIGTACDQSTLPLKITDFLHEGELRPRPTVGAPAHHNAVAPNERLAAAFTVVDGLRAQAYAANTRRSYGGHVVAFADWCARNGASALPATAQTVAQHLAEYTIGIDADEQSAADLLDGVDDVAQLAAVRRPVTVGIRLAAINKVHRYAGLPQPGSEAEITELMRGIRRTYGVAPQHAKAAIDLDGLAALVRATRAHQFPGLRDALAILLRGAGWSAGQIVRLTWSGIAIHQDRVVVSVGPDGRGGGQTTTTFTSGRRGRIGDPVALVQALSQCAPGRARGHVFVTVKNPTTALTRQAVTMLCNTLAAALGGYQGLPTAPVGQVQALVISARSDRSAIAVRDEALVTVGWFTALRRSNLSALTWGDVTFTNDTIRIDVTRSKTDQEGEGVTLWLPDPRPGQQPLVSPTAALRVWHAWVSEQVGADPCRTRRREPVFARLDKGGLLEQGPHGELRRISGERINTIIQTLATAANLAIDLAVDDGARHPFGAHSLRAGFVTEALRDDKLTLTEVQAVTGHKSLKVLSGYYREVNSTNRNPVQRLLRNLESEAGA